MKILHLLTGGRTGGIETLCREISKNSELEHGFCFLTFGGEVCEDMKTEGKNVYELYHLGGTWSFQKLRALLKMAKKYDILIVHNEDPFLEMYFIITKILLKRPGVRYIHSCYSDSMQQDSGRLKRGLKRIMRQLSLDVSELNIFVSQEGKRSCQALYRCNERKCRIIYNGISDKYLKMGRNNVVRVDEPIELLYVGRLEKIKGIDNLIKAFSMFYQKYDTHLSLVGDGTEKEKLIKCAEDCHLKVSENRDGDVTFWGTQINIVPFLQRASLFIYPSVCQEVFGISIVEAMAFGIPCIANRVGGIPEIIIDGENGYLTEANTVEALYEKMNLAITELKKEENRKLITQEAFRTAEKYSIKNTCLQLDRELSDLYGKK